MAEAVASAWIRVVDHQTLNPKGSLGIYRSVHFKDLAIGVVPVDRHGRTYSRRPDRGIEPPNARARCTLSRKHPRQSRSPAHPNQNGADGHRQSNPPTTNTAPSRRRIRSQSKEF
jgi:hypothetical protein